MANINLIKPERIDLKQHPILNEKWVQDVIEKDPSILCLGELDVIDKERAQPKAGRLDLLLRDPESNRRYEVEIQLGKVDESHIIRTIEYRDIERKRYPQYDHIAVIIAEDITSRFLNVINIFNGFIPLMALQMSAYKINDDYFLQFTKVLDVVNLGPIDGDGPEEPKDRNYWEKKATKETVAIADELLKLILGFAPGYELKYNKFYIGLAKDGQPDNFAIFRPRKRNLQMGFRLEQSEDIEKLLENADLDVLDYDAIFSRYRIKLSKHDIDKHKQLITDLLQKAYNQANVE
jgi:hypothetical protein